MRVKTFIIALIVVVGMSIGWALYSNQQDDHRRDAQVEACERGNLKVEILAGAIRLAAAKSSNAELQAGMTGLLHRMGRIPHTNEDGATNCQAAIP